MTTAMTTHTPTGSEEPLPPPADQVFYNLNFDIEVKIIESDFASVGRAIVTIFQNG